MNRTPEMLRAGVGLKRPSSMALISNESAREQRAYYIHHHFFWGMNRWSVADRARLEDDDLIDRLYHQAQAKHVFDVDEDFYLVWLAGNYGPVPYYTALDIAKDAVTMGAGTFPASGQ